jgi:hypothetical protein
MFGLFKKKTADIPNPSVPKPPVPTQLSVPDDHPLDQPFDHPMPDPSTSFSEDADLAEIQKAIDGVKTDDFEGPNAILDERDTGEHNDMMSNFDLEEPEQVQQTIGPVKAIPKAPEVKQEAKFRSSYEMPELSKPSVQFKPVEQEEPEEKEEMELPSFDEDLPAEQQKALPKSYNLTNMPDPENVSVKKQAFSIYINVKDYGRIFKEIKYIDTFSKRCYRTVLRLKDLSGNQTKLYQRFHADLTYINERLTLMDTIFFEQNG